MEDMVTLFYFSNTTHVLANNLDNHTSYKVNIAAYTKIGAGPTTEEIVYTTNETGNIVKIMILFYFQSSVAEFLYICILKLRSVK